jgi:hypothetical protein
VTTIVSLAVMTAVFALAFYGLKAAWARFKTAPPGELIQVDRETYGERPALLGLIEEAEKDHRAEVPLRTMMIISSAAGVLAVLAGFAFLHLMYRSAPLLSAHQSVRPAITMTTPRVVRSDFVDSPRVRVVIDDSSPDALPVEDLLRRCAAFEITYVTTEGTVKCYSEGSPNAQLLLNRTRTQDTKCAVQQQGFGAVVTAATDAVAKEVSERRPIDRYAELVYFVLTFFGVFLRLCWEASKSVRGRRKTSPYFTPQALITSLVLAIATYAMIIQSGLAGSSDLLSFKTGIFAMYNGILSSGLIRDFNTLRPTTAPAAPTP